MATEVTEVRIYPYGDGTGNLKAFADITLNGDFVVKGLKVMEGRNGPFIGFPQTKSKDGTKDYDVCFPLSKQLRDGISLIIFEQYDQVVNQA